MDLGAGGPHPYFNPLFAGQLSTMLKGGWRQGGFGLMPRFYLSFCTRAKSGLMSRSSTPDFNSDFNPASVAQLSTMLEGGQRMAVRVGGFGHMPQSYVSFCTRAKYHAYKFGSIGAGGGGGAHPDFNPDSVA